MGYGGAGEVQDDNQYILQRYARRHRGVRCHERRVLRQCQEMAARDRTEL